MKAYCTSKVNINQILAIIKEVFNILDIIFSYPESFKARQILKAIQ